MCPPNPRERGNHASLVWANPSVCRTPGTGQTRRSVPTGMRAPCVGADLCVRPGFAWAKHTRTGQTRRSAPTGYNPLPHPHLPLLPLLPDIPAALPTRPVRRQIRRLAVQQLGDGQDLDTWVVRVHEGIVVQP